MIIEDSDLQARSDQMNAVDFDKPRTFRVQKMERTKNNQQPWSIHMEGYSGRPYKPCLGMRRGLTAAWGRDTSLWHGRLITLFCEPSVKYGGAEVGGIQICAVSHIDEPLRFPRTINKHQRTMHTFDVIPTDTDVKKEFVLTHWQQDIEQAETNKQLDTIVQQVKAEFGNDALLKIKDAVTEARHRVSAAEMEEPKEPPELEGNPY
jgi:hypothetical protein